MKFYTNPHWLNLDKIPQNVYDLNSAYFYVSLLNKEQKYKFLSKLNPEARRAFTPILSIKDEFTYNEDEADWVVFPPCSPYIGFSEYISYYQDFLSTTQTKVALFYFSSDDRVITCGKDIEIFRGGAFREENAENVHGSLYVVADYYRGNLAPKELKVSFCGVTDNNPDREFVISNFKNYDYFNLIDRKYWAGMDELDRKIKDSYIIGPSDKRKKDFIENMENSLYSLVVRGTSNTSYRLYESFMMGRIPVFINTDVMLPFEDIIPYKSNMVFLEYHDDYDKELRKFHESHTEEELFKIQLENRNIWETYFRADSAFYSRKKFIKI